MKKLVFTAASVFGAIFAANAQGGSSESCTGCTALSYDLCTTHVTVSLANSLDMNCDNCNDLQACANSISEWSSGLSLGSASFSVASTKNYSVYAGLSSGTMAKSGGGAGIGIGGGANQIQIKGKVSSNNTGGSNMASSATALAVRSGNTQATAGTKIIGAAPASLIQKNANLQISTGALPLNMSNGDYSVDVVIAAIQD